MIRARIDRWFARFRQHGDPRLVAKVFDQAAPELWRVAAHLCRDRHDAEDAVQSTFLAAIESKESWDDERPLLPWLVGLLVNRVREQRRALARVVDASRLGVREVVDPATAAGERELGAAFVAALGSVSEPFRSVVEQHFVHGLSAVEIAAATGVPAATVRTRLHRGLEQLRQKLPAGAVVGSLVPLRIPGELFASMREAVMAQVPGGATVAVGSGAVVFSVFSVLAMKKGLLAVAAVVGMVLWWSAGSSSGQPVAVAEGDARVAPAVAAAAGEAAASDESERVASAVSQPAASERVPALAGDPSATLALLVRHGATKTPLADVQVRVMREPPPRSPVASTSRDAAASVPVATSAASDEAAPDSADGRTDAQGRAVLRVAAGRVRVWVGSGQPTIQSVNAPPATTTEHVVDVAPVFTTDVLVVDAQGAPVAGAGIFASNERGLPVMQEIGRTDRDGRWREPRIELQLLVRAVRAGNVASPASVLTGKEGPVVLQLGGEAATIHGRVLDAAGAPVPAAVVLFVPDDAVDNSQWPNTARSDAQGRYRCDWLTPGSHHLLVRDQRDAKDPRVLMAAATAVAGEPHATDLQFGEGGTLVVRLRRHDGHPVVNHSVQLVRKASEIPVAFAPWCYFGGMTDADGTCTFRGVLRGHYLLTVSHYEAKVCREIEVRTGEPVVFEHRFGELQTLQITIVDEHGRPRPGIRVQRKISESEATTRTTDAKGRVWFELLEPGEYEITLAANETALPQSHHRVSTGKPVRLVMPMDGANGRVIGRVGVPRGELPADLSLSLHRGLRENPFRPDTVFVTLDATSGAFHCDDLPAGRYHFSAVTRKPFANLAQRADIDVSASGTVDLGTIELGSGEIHVDVRMASGDPGHVHAAVRLPGVDFFTGEPRQPSMARPIRRQHLSPGAYRVMVWGENVLPAFADATVAIDQVTPLAIDVQRGVRTEVRLPGSIGMLTVHFPDGSVVREMVLELRSWVRGLAPGDYRVEYTDFAGERHEAAFPVRVEPGEPIELSLARSR